MRPAGRNGTQTGLLPIDLRVGVDIAEVRHIAGQITGHAVGIDRTVHWSPLRATTIWLAITVLVLATGGEWFLQAVYGDNEVVCHQVSLPNALIEMPEASGVAASRQTPNLFWMTNDSGHPRLFAVDENGQVRGRINVANAELIDWEDLSVSRCGDRSCLYIADIGDNDARRSSVKVYRMPEPAVHEKTRQADGMELRYPDGPHDAEAMFVLPDDNIYLITKESPSVVYHASRFDPGGTIALERVMALPLHNVTDAEASADGSWIAVRTKDEAVFYRTDALLHGDVEHGTAVSLAEFTEPQGEGITFGAGNAVYLAGEGGGKGAPGTFLRLECSLPQKRP